MEQVSAVLITLNEEKNLPRCLQALQWADEIVVLDNGSTDRTVDIASEHGATVHVCEWLGFGRTKQRAVTLASHRWVLVVDADEVITPALQEAIRGKLQAPDHAAYRIKRRSFYLGRLIAHSGWSRDYTLRLFDRTQAAFNDKPVHESVQTDRPIGVIEEHMLHYTYPTLRSHIDKMLRYSELGARSLYEKGRRSSVAGALCRGAAKFFKMYLAQSGFLDGVEGLALASISAFGVSYKYLYLWELWNRSSST